MVRRKIKFNSRFLDKYLGTDVTFLESDLPTILEDLHNVYRFYLKNGDFYPKYSFLSRPALQFLEMFVENELQGIPNFFDEIRTNVNEIRLYFKLNRIDEEYPDDFKARLETLVKDK